MEFEGYYGKHRNHNNRVAQMGVVQKRMTKTLRVRIDDKLDEEIQRKVKETGKNESILTRMLWQYYLNRERDDAWAEEVKELTNRR